MCVCVLNIINFSTYEFMAVSSFPLFSFFMFATGFFASEKPGSCHLLYIYLFDTPPPICNKLLVTAAGCPPNHPPVGGSAILCQGTVALPYF